MKTKDPARFVILISECLFFLQAFEGYCQEGDEAAVKVRRRFCKDRGRTAENIPLLNLESGLALLSPVLAFAARIKNDEWTKEGFSIAPRYQCEMRNPSDIPCTFETAVVLRVMRNALAHYPDYLSGQYGPTIFFEPGVVTFYSKDYGKVHFSDNNGWLYFLTDFLKATWQLAKKQWQG